MSRSVFCTGCGLPLEVPADYKRRKMQCTHCGVLCELPPPDPPNVPAASPAPPAVLPPSPPAPIEPPRTSVIPPEPSPAARAAKSAVPKKQRTIILTCEFCGEGVRVAVGKDEAGTCPCCGSPVAPPFPSRPPPSDPLPQPVPKPTTLADEWAKTGVVFSTQDDGNPYPIHGAGDVRCPACRRTAPKNSVLCTGCGYNFETGVKPSQKSYELYANQWEVGMPLRRRRNLFLAGQAVVVSLGLLGALLHGSFWVFLGSWVFFTPLLAFILGTYERIELRRTARGQVRLTRTWRVCFFQRPATTIGLRGYEGVLTGLVNETGCWEWLIFFILLGFGIIPGVLWFYLAIHRDTFFVALTKDHGYPAEPLCRSGNQEQMRAIAAALHDVAGMPYGR